MYVSRRGLVASVAVPEGLAWCTRLNLNNSIPLVNTSMYRIMKLCN